jgi:Flp pilus assembly protein TadD
MPPASPVTSRSAPRPRPRLALIAGLVALALAGCTGRGGSLGAGLGGITGSLGASAQPTTPEGWRAEAEEWGRRYDAQPGDRTAALRYGQALRATGQNAQAMAVLQAAVLKHTQDRELLGAFGRTLMDNGQFRQAQDVLARAHAPERPDWRILSAQGAVADQLGEHERAQAFYLAALRIAPDEPTVMSNLGLSYALTRRLPEGERVLRTAVAHPRADARVRQNLTLVLGLQGRFDEASTWARKDMPPAEAEATVTQLRRMVSQPNAWDKLRQGGKPSARPARAGARDQSLARST